MPQVSSPDLNAMGFLGLQTKNSNSMDQVSADAKAALFDKFSLSSKADHTGSLYQFGSRENLHSQIEKDLRIPTVAKINQYVDFIQAQTGLFDITKNKIDQETNNADKVRDLLDAVNDSGTLPDECFIGYNKSNSTDYTLELRDPTSKDYVIPDSSGSKIGARIRVMQLNRYDVNGDDVITHLNQILGSEMVKYLIAQAALETSNQTATITDVIKTVLKDGKLAVYDRRFNDQLGSQWVQN
jgi:hypothetical protein